jgi:hypothetical protein
MKAFWLGPVCAMVLFAANASAAETLVDPPAISVPPGLTEKVIAKSIRLGGAQRGWLVTRQDPGYMESTLHLRTHVARVGIKYDTRSIQIRYLASENLDYAIKKGVPRIHGNYLKWVNNLVNDISLQLQAAEMDLEKAE